MADLTSQKHNDRWLSDLLRGASKPGFPRAVAALARASRANKADDYGTARTQSALGEELFVASGNTAGALRARFEQIFAAQITRQGDECRREATAAFAASETHPYAWLQIQLELEKGVCSLLGDEDWGADERLSRHAMERARQSNYQELYLRALFFAADNQVGNGDLSGGLKTATAGLASYWSGEISAVRGYSLYNLLGSAPELATNRPHLVMAIWREATALVDSEDDILTRAWAHNVAARADVAAQQPQIAKREFAEAAHLFALAPQTEASRNYVLENEILTAQLEARLGQFESGIARLTGIQNQVQSRSDKLFEQMFYATLGELQLRGHHALQAEQAFRPALELSEQRLSLLNSEAQRIAWSKESANVYLGMAEAELVQGRTQESLEYFEWYLGAAGRSGGKGRSRSHDAAPDPKLLTDRLPMLSGQTVVAFGSLPDGLAIWTFDNRGVHAQWIPQSDQDLQELAGTYYDLASDARSEVTALRRDSQRLYGALIAPVEQRLDSGRTLVIEADGWLARVPFESLLDSSGHYLIERAAIVHSLGQGMDASLHPSIPISKDLHALVVGSAASSQAEGLIPLPDVAAEAGAVARDFNSAAVFEGSEATLAAVEGELPAAAVFHFTGHSLARPNGAALMLAATGPQQGAPVLLGGDRLRHLDLRNLELAVLSTCNTGSGDDGSRGFNHIAEGLQRAGVPHVVASRWAVDSVETRKFIEAFYRSALSGQPVSEAIRQTSRSMMADPRTAHPYYWSAFSAYGRP